MPGAQPEIQHTIAQLLCMHRAGACVPPTHLHGIVSLYRLGLSVHSKASLQSEDELKPLFYNITTLLSPMKESQQIGKHRPWYTERNWKTSEFSQ